MVDFPRVFICTLSILGRICRQCRVNGEMTLTVYQMTRWASCSTVKSSSHSWRHTTDKHVSKDWNPSIKKIIHFYQQSTSRFFGSSTALSLQIKFTALILCDMVLQPYWDSLRCEQCHQGEGTSEILYLLTAKPEAFFHCQYWLSTKVTWHHTFLEKKYNFKLEGYNPRHFVFIWLSHGQK